MTIKKKLKIWLLVEKNRFTDYENKRFAETAKKDGILLTIADPEEFEIVVTEKGNKSMFYKGKPVELPDCAIPRMGGETTYFAFAVIRQLEKLGVFILNSRRSTQRAKDKLQTMQALASDNIPIPKTMLANFPIDYEIVKQEIGYPLVLKTVSGVEGKGVTLCKDETQLRDFLGLFETSKSRNANLLLQEFISKSEGTDIRVIILGRKIIGAMKRTAKKGAFKANYSEGGTVEKFELDSACKKIALDATESLGLNMVGVDLLFDGKGKYKVCELNSAPGFKGFEQATGLDIAKITYDYIREKLEKGSKPTIHLLIDRLAGKK